MVSNFQNNQSTFNKIRDFVKTIPKGKVCTYGQVASHLGLKSPRIIGWALRGNQDKNIPCHRVVQKEGTLSPSFSLGGKEGQRKRLLLDNTPFVSEYCVDLVRALYRPKKNY